MLDKKFKDWFLGFFEAEGSLIVTNRGDLHFVITQKYNSIWVLYYIKYTLGFGSVIKQGKTLFRYVVQDKDELRKIIEILNGNIVQNYKYNDLEKFIISYNNYYKDNLSFIEERKQPTLDDAWLSGFIDGKGCFNILYLSTKDEFNIRFLVSQNEDLNFLKDVLKRGTIEKNKKLGKNIYEIKDSKINITNMEIIDEYLKKFELKTNKANNYGLWHYLKNQINKERKNGMKNEEKLNLINLIKKHNENME